MRQLYFKISPQDKINRNDGEKDIYQTDIQHLKSGEKKLLIELIPGINPTTGYMIPGLTICLKSISGTDITPIQPGQGMENIEGYDMIYFEYLKPDKEYELKVRVTIVEICEFELPGKNGEKYKVAIFRCSLKVENPKATLDTAVSNYVENEVYNEFTEIYNDNPWYRLILSGINEFEYKTSTFQSQKDVEYFEHGLINKDAERKGTLAILRGGLKSKKPIAYMNAAVSQYVGHEQFNEFVEIQMNNPWVRLILRGINQFKYEPFDSQRLK